MSSFPKVQVRNGSLQGGVKDMDNVSFPMTAYLKALYIQHPCLGHDIMQTFNYDKSVSSALFLQHNHAFATVCTVQPLPVLPLLAD